ncbi:hypothetical protein [Desulfosporosinus sp. BG]|uniref:hypothetical protein n=1 Tax=Desulfosporosinus sp. BG TaxID=1633135 RepID=UPI00083B7ADC|nr:hypothetical protein [Desulfosporosinus sp. BG]ODA41074.1 hypothetical protein DSBG_2112 [Desulfosporosinus sp. BG]
MANVSERVNQVIKTEVKKFTLDSFQRFCWNSPLVGDEDFSSIVSKFFDCASAEVHKDVIILTDDKGHTRWARTAEINYFLDYASSQYLNLDEVKLEEKPMDYARFNEESGSIVCELEGYIRAQNRDSGGASDLHNELLANFVREQILRVKPYFDYLESEVYLKVNVNQSKPLIIGGPIVYHEKGRLCHGR